MGNPLRLILTGGQVADVTQGAALIAGIPTTAVSADKGYDSDELVKTIETADAIANIPPRSNRIDKHPVDWHRYKAVTVRPLPSFRVNRSQAAAA